MSSHSGIPYGSHMWSHSCKPWMARVWCERWCAQHTDQRQHTHRRNASSHVIIFIYTVNDTCHHNHSYGVAKISRLLKIIGLFYKRSPMNDTRYHGHVYEGLHIDVSNVMTFICVFTYMYTGREPRPRAQLVFVEIRHGCPRKYCWQWRQTPCPCLPGRGNPIHMYICTCVHTHLHIYIYIYSNTCSTFLHTPTDPHNKKNTYISTEKYIHTVKHEDRFDACDRVQHETGQAHEKNIRIWKEVPKGCTLAKHAPKLVKRAWRACNSETAECHDGYPYQNDTKKCGWHKLCPSSTNCENRSKNWANL